MEFKHVSFEVPGFIYAIYHFKCTTSCKMNPGSAQYGEKREIRTCSKTCNFYFWTFGSWSECKLDGGNCGKGNLNWAIKVELNINESFFNLTVASDFGQFCP